MNGAVLRVSLDAVELCGPGLAGWGLGRLILAGREPYKPSPIVIGAPDALSPAESRRATPSTRLALMVAASAVRQSGHDPAGLPAVFASSNADGETIAAILAALARPGREVSPTRFHNSVHNAPSGYWGVAMQSREAVTSLTGFDASFAAGLLEACVVAVSGRRPVLLAAYDLPYPEPLNGVRRIEAGFGVALVLNPSRSGRTLAELQVSMAATVGGASQCAEPGLEALRRGNPAARSLPLLASLTAKAASTIRLDFNSAVLVAAVAPC